MDPRFESAVRSMMSFVGGAMMWVGLMTMCPPLGMRVGVTADPGRLSMTPLSRAERAEWAALVERLR